MDSSGKVYDYEVAIIGAGFAGLGAAIKLMERGRNNFIVFERAEEVGGTWRDNTYPGCGCDIPSILYSFSFYQNPDWTEAFSGQEEILDYLKKSVVHYKIADQIQFQTEIIEAKFQESEGYWILKDQNGKPYSARTVVAALGPLNVPNIPSFKGQSSFKGKSFHSSEWDHDYDLKGKTVAVVGTGASALQFIPIIAKEVESLHVFQRTPAWVIAKPNPSIPSFVKSIFRVLPFYMKIIRWIMFWFLEFRGLGFLGNDFIQRFFQWESERYIKKTISDTKLQNAVTPDFKFGCKRILLSNDYYQTLEMDHVHLIDSGLNLIEGNTLHAQDGRKAEVDTIIYGTGFHAADFIRNFEITGIGGRSLLNEWKTTGPEAYFGMCTNGFPNLLFMAGPNTGLGSNSIIHVIESQINFIIDYIESLDELGSKKYLDVNEMMEEKYNKEVQQKFGKTVWGSGCKSWYLNKKGKNTTLLPELPSAYRRKIKKIRKEDFEIIEI